MTVTLNSETGEPVGQSTDEKYTWSQVAAMNQPCPRCGKRVTFGAVPAGGKESVGEPLFYVGRPEYPCNCFGPEVV